MELETETRAIVTSFYREVERARRTIVRHVESLMANQERLDAEYDSLFESLLARADDFGAEEFEAFKGLGQLRKLRNLNFTTILSLQYLRMCIWLMTDGVELDEPPNPGLAIRRLREVNIALAGSSATQVKRLECSVVESLIRFVDDQSDHTKAIRFALSSVDDDVARIFGEAMQVAGG